MNERRITLAVTNDLVIDQRIHRIATTLYESGADVLLVGRLLPDSLPVFSKQYGTKRIRMFFKKGPFFYLCFNFRLFIFLLFIKSHVIVSNDLDTLLACYLVSRIKRIPLVYDSHELFTEVPELQGRQRVQKIWSTLEKLVIPKIKYAYTVCDSVANIYKKQYGISFLTIRNFPVKKQNLPFPELYQDIKTKKIIVYQGYLNLGRGIEKVINALPYLENVCFLIIGKGDIEFHLKELVEKSKVTDKVIFTGIIPYDKLHGYTQMAHVGISLEENMGKNYYYALPNKMFDYIQAKVPVLGSAFPEIEKIINDYNIGLTTSVTNPKEIAEILDKMLNDEKLRNEWIKNLEKAADELTWENERIKLINFYRQNSLI